MSHNTVNATGLVRSGILTLPLSGALKMIGNLGTFDSVGYGIPQATEARTVTGVGFFVGELVGSVFPALLTPFWVFALFTHLVVRARRRLLVSGLVCCLLGAGMTISALGVINYAFPALGRAYQHGHPFAMDLADSFFVWPQGAVIYPAVLYPIGAVLFTIAIWRSQTAARLAAVLFALSSILIAIPFPLHALRLTGGLVGFAAGSWIAVVVRRQLAGHASPFDSPRSIGS